MRTNSGKRTLAEDISIAPNHQWLGVFAGILHQPPADSKAVYSSSTLVTLGRARKGELLQKLLGRLVPQSLVRAHCIVDLSGDAGSVLVRFGQQAKGQEGQLRRLFQQPRLHELHLVLGLW